MSEIEIKQLPSMRVVEFVTKSATPEGDSLQKMETWAQEHGIQPRSPGHRVFGFDNCQPHPNHIYTVWLQIAPDSEPDMPYKDIPGGDYAVKHVTGAEQIGPGWKSLQAWLHGSTYQYGGQEALEALHSAFDTPEAEIEVDLYMPVRD